MRRKVATVLRVARIVAARIGCQNRPMDEQEWMRRIDEHLETSKDHMREGNELMARIDETLERNTDALERNSLAFADLREFLEQVTTVLAAMTTEMREGRRAFVEESRMQRRALFAILDRLEGGAGPSPA